MKYLDKVNEKVLVKKLTEKMWKKYKYGYDFYKKYINYGKCNGKSYKEKRFYLVS